MSTFTSINDKVSTLTGGQIVDLEMLEREVKKICHYVEYVAFLLKDGEALVAMVFPSRKLLSNPDYEKTPEEGCFCPRNLQELGKCLSGCMHTLNVTLLPGYAKISSAVIINSPLSVEEHTLTPSLNIIPENIILKYKDHLLNLFGNNLLVKEDAFNMKLN